MVNIKPAQSWYEASLLPEERKQRGHFSTPPLLVERILDACGYSASSDLSALRVLDPACGSGNFLVGAARRMIAAGLHRQLAPEIILTQIQRNLWGLDPDPVACFLAEMEVQGAIAEMCATSVTPLHIHQADGLSLPWRQSSNVDLFLANPPYLATKNIDLHSYRSTWQRGQTDSYLLFLELALHVVRPGGWLALVVPDALLARINATRERQQLLAFTTVHHLWHLAHLFAAHVGAVVIIAQKHPPACTHQVLWRRERWQQTLPLSDEQHVMQSQLQAQPQAQLRYLLGRRDNVQALITAIHTHYSNREHIKEQEERVFAPLRTLVSIQRGEELGKGSPYLRSGMPTDPQAAHLVVRGGSDVRPYSAPAGRYWIAHEHVIKPLTRYLAPKLLVVKSSAHLQATLDVRGHVALQTLYLLVPHVHVENAQEELYWLLALLNSRVLRDYVYLLYTAYKWVQPQIEQHVLESLPIPTFSTKSTGLWSERTAIIERAKSLFAACSIPIPVVELKQQNEKLFAEQERAIHSLYCSVLQAADKGVVPYD